jgi:hypothetical protein
MTSINKRIKYKKGWVKLMEVFVAILLLIGVLVVVVNTINAPDKNKFYTEIYKNELGILRDIELNNTLRTEVLSANPPLEWNNFDDNGLQEIKTRITYLSPPNLECKAKICWMSDACILDELSGDNVYAESVIISANLSVYSPRQLKLFCMQNNI